MPLDSYANLQNSVLDWIARPDDPLVAPAVPDMILMFEEEARDRLQIRFSEKTVALTQMPGVETIPLPLDYGELRSLWINTNRGKRHFCYQTPRNMDMNLYYLAGYPAAYTIEGLNLRVVGTPSADVGAPIEVTLTPDATATVLTDPRLVGNSYLGLMPQTANAADAMTSLWVVLGTGSAVIHHANSSNTDQVFLYTIANGAPNALTEPPPLDTLVQGQIYLDYLSGITGLSDAAPTNWLLDQYPSAYLWGTLANAALYIGDDPRVQGWLASREAAIERIRLADRRAKYPSGLMIQTDVRNP